jgi:exonuclease III
MIGRKTHPQGAAEASATGGARDLNIAPEPRDMHNPKRCGLRIDHILLSPALVPKCTACTIDLEPRKRERPSDHARLLPT